MTRQQRGAENNETYEHYDGDCDCRAWLMDGCDPKVMLDVDPAPAFKLRGGRPPRDAVEAGGIEVPPEFDGARPSGKGRNVPEGDRCGAVPSRWWEGASPKDAAEGPTGGTGGSTDDDGGRGGLRSEASDSRSCIDERSAGG